MKTRTHTCAATGCQHRIPAHLLMCMDHWRMVPVALRRLVLATNRARMWSPSVANVQTYREAVANAVAALAEKQTKRMSESGTLPLLKEEHGNNTTTRRQPT